MRWKSKPQNSSDKIKLEIKDIESIKYRSLKEAQHCISASQITEWEVWTSLYRVLSPHRRFGKQTLRCPRALLNSSLAPHYRAWLAQLPQCPDASHTSHASQEGPDHDAALLPSGEGKSACRCQGRMAAVRGWNQAFSGGLSIPAFYLVPFFWPTWLLTFLCDPADAQEEEDPTQLQPTHGVSRRLGDGLQRAPLPYCVRQVRLTAHWASLHRIQRWKWFYSF